MRVRTMTWNIHKGIGGIDRRYDIGRIVAVLQHYAPDVVLLQEVAQDMPSLKGHDQVSLLSEALGLHQAFHAEHQFRAGGYGNLILSRWPLHDARRVDCLEAASPRDGRVALEQTRAYRKGRTRWPGT